MLIFILWIAAHSWAVPSAYFEHHVAPPIDEMNYFDRMQSQKEKIRALKGLEKDFAEQTLAAFQNIIGQYDLAFTTYYHAQPKRNFQQKKISTRNMSDAKAKLCEIAATKQILILNEWHHMAQHRAFGRSLLPCLKKAGYKYFALEALTESTEDLQKRGRVSWRKSGFYTEDPQMSRMIQQAMNTDWTVISYDRGLSGCKKDCMSKENIILREKIAAENIFEQTLAKDPQAKVFIWVGFDHGWKTDLFDDGASSTMGLVLKNLSGIDPFVVGQYSELDKDISSEFSSAIRAAKISKPVFVSTKSIDFHSENLDGLILHPLRKSKDGRAAWLYAPKEEKQKIQIKCKKCSKADQILVQVFPGIKPDADTPPMDQNLARKKAVNLIAPNGVYTIKVFKDNRVIFKDTIYLNSKKKNRIDIKGAMNMDHFE